MKDKHYEAREQIKWDSRYNRNHYASKVIIQLYDRKKVVDDAEQVANREENQDDAQGLNLLLKIVITRVI